MYFGLFFIRFQIQNVDKKIRESNTGIEEELTRTVSSINQIWTGILQINIDVMRATASCHLDSPLIHCQRPVRDVLVPRHQRVLAGRRHEGDDRAAKWGGKEAGRQLLLRAYGTQQGQPGENKVY